MLVFHFSDFLIWEDNAPLEALLELLDIYSPTHCVKSVCIRSYSGPYFPEFGLNTEKVSTRIQSKYGKIRTRVTPNTDTFCSVTGGSENDAYLRVMVLKNFNHLCELYLRLALIE